MATINPIGLDLTTGRKRKLEIGDSLLGAGTQIVSKSSHGFVALDAIRHNGTTWVKAQADSENTLADGVVIAVLNTNTFVVADSGFYTITGHSLTENNWHFLSSTTAGLLTSSPPSEFVQPLVKALDANTIRIYPSTGYLAASGGVSGSANGLSLVGEHVLSSPATLLQVTGLDLDSQKLYKIAFSLNFAGTPGTTQVFVTYNDDTAQTGYFKERHSGSSTIGTSNDSLIENASLSTGNIRAGTGDLFSSVNSAGTSEYPGFSFTVLGSSIGNMGVIYKDITANITKFSIRSNNMTFGIGSYLRVYK